MTTRGLRAVALGVLLSAGCAAKAPPAAVPPRAVPAATPAGADPVAVAATATPRALPDVTRGENLALAFDPILASPSLARASVGLVVRSLATGETLFTRNGRTWLVPASTMKVLTTVAAAHRLGWGFRFETRLVGTGPIVNGVLQGDLVAVGTGDPTLNPRHPARMTAFDDWARALAAQGIRRIAGHIVGDDAAIEPPGWGVGWAWDDLVVGYGAAYGALQYNDNEAEVTMGPGSTPGAPPVVYVSPANHGLLLDVTAVTAAADAAPSLGVARSPGTRFLDVTGQAPLGSTPVTEMVAVANPTAFFAAELRATLFRHGITVDGAAVDIDEMSDRPRAADGTTLLVDLSPPLSEIVQPMLQWSRNSYAETLLHALDQTPPASAGDGVAALRATLADLGVAPEGFHIRDGSGLSRNDYLSADALIETLAAAWARPDLRGPLLAALPEAGRPGTLSRRLANTPAAGRVHAKTGSMSNVRSLAGYLETAAGEPLAFAFICNGFDVPGGEIDARVNELLLALVGLDPPTR